MRAASTRREHLCSAQEVAEHHNSLLEQYGGTQLILRIDRIEPSKNIVRGFQAYDELLELHPENRKVATLMQIAARVLPFYYMVGFPVEVLTGHLNIADLLSGFAIQAAWTIIAIFLYRRLWRAGLRRYAAVGG